MNKYYKNEERCDKAQEVVYAQKAIKEKRVLITLYK